MSKTITIASLRKHLDHSRARLSLEKSTLLQLHPLKAPVNPEEYAFSYIRAERIGMRAINRRLGEIDWLPMQLDPTSEILGDGRLSMKRWVKESWAGQPDSEDFGNDFIHTLARGGIECGWDSPDMIKLLIRTANLFRDLSCLIGLLYYCNWLEENKVEAVAVSDPDNLNLAAEEITEVIQSPEMYDHIRAQEQTNERARKAKRAEPQSQPQQKTKRRPKLRVIENEHYIDPYAPEPLPV